MASNALFSLLVAQTWQVSLLFVVVWILVRTFARHRPHLAHALWALVLIKCLTPPIVSSPVSPFCWLRGEPVQATEKQPAGSIPMTAPVSADQLNSESPLREIVTYAVPIISKSALDQKSQQQAANQYDRNRDLALDQAVASSLGVVTLSKLENSSALFWKRNLVWIWLVTAAFLLSITLMRLLLFSRWIYRSPTIVDPAANQTLSDLCKQLNFNRPVRLRLLKLPVGPAVYGLLRPTILLPHTLLKDKSADELKPLLAHELIHIRRGDLWWATIQTLSACLFWFHPLIRFAVRMVTRESERSCDEETVASLGCRVSDYAMQLVEVLEHKHRLRVAPALPGVRPVDITSARLERVMNFGNGIHSRAPFWVWLVLVVGCFISLPGAALVFAQEEGTAEPNADVALKEKLPSAPMVASDLPLRQWKEIDPRSSSNVQKDHSQSEGTKNTSGHDKSDWLVSRYDATQILNQFRKSNKTNEMELLNSLGCQFPKEGISSTAGNAEATVETSIGPVKLGNQNPTMHLDGSTLYVYGTEQTHLSLIRTLEHFSKYGFASIAVDTQLMTMPLKELSSLTVDWNVAAVEGADILHTEQLADGSHAAIPPATHAASIPSIDVPPKGSTKVTAVNYVEQASPLLHATLGQEAMQDLLESCKANGLINILQSPTVVMNNGQHASVFSGTTRPFVVGLNKVESNDQNALALQPVIKLLHDGTKIRFDATIVDSASQSEVPFLSNVPYVNRLYTNVTATNQINLTCVMERSKILEVDTVSIPLKTGQATQPQIQMPSVATTRIQSTLPVNAGDTLVLCGIQKTKEGKQEAFVALLTCYFPESKPRKLDTEAKNATPDEATRLLSVTRQQLVNGKLSRNVILVAEDSYRMRGGEVLNIKVDEILPLRAHSPSTPVVNGDMRSHIGCPIKVEGDGMISLPLLTKFSVKEMTIRNIESEIRRRYAETKVHPNAQVNVRVGSIVSELKQGSEPSILRIEGALTSPSSNQTDYRPLVESLKKQGTSPTIEGDVRFQVSNTETTVESEPLSVDSGTDLRARGDYGKVEFANEKTLYQFKGNVKFSSTDMSIEAAELKYQTQDKDLLLLDLKGNVHMAINSGTTDQWELKAEQILFKPETGKLILRGKATFTRKNDGASQNFSGSQIEIDVNNDDVNVRDMNQAKFKK